MNYRALITVLLLLAGLAAGAQEKRNLLQKSLEKVNIGEYLEKAYVPYAAYEDRAFWEAVPAEVREKAVKAAERAMENAPASIPLTAYLEFVRIGDRAHCDGLQGAQNRQLETLVMGELLEGKGRFMDAIIDNAWALCERSTWVGTAHLANQKRRAGVPDFKDIIIDLSSGETSTLMSWTYYFFKKNFDKVSPIIAERIKYEVTRRTLEPFAQRDDMWWQGFRSNFVNNWNIWCNFNVLMTCLLIEDDPAVRTEIVKKGMRSVDRFINYYKSDGGCEEGPSYWDHAPGKLMEYLEVLKEVTGGEIDLFKEPLIREMGRYIARTHIDNNYFVNFADASATGYSLPTVIYRYGKNCGDAELMQFGRYMGGLSGVAQNPLQGSITMKLANLKMYDEFLKAEGKAPYYKSVWLDGVQVAVARDKAGTNKGLFFAAKGGFNNESHNHNDVGSFVLYRDGKPMLVDAGVGTYTAQTFSGRRYDIWTMQSGWHNLPVVNGQMEAFGTKYRGRDVQFRDNGRKMVFSLDIAPAYPEKAKCEKWLRTYTFDRGHGLTVADDYRVKAVEGDFVFHYLTCCAVNEVKPGVVEFTDKDRKITMTYDPKALQFSQEDKVMEDRRLQRVWGDKLVRVSLKVKNPQVQGKTAVKFR